MNFGKWIVAAFIFFTVFIATLVGVCLRQDISLVRRDYYQAELMHQEKMDQVANTQQLPHPPEFRLVNGRLELAFDQLDSIESGTLRIMRPSDTRLDRHFELKASAEELLQFQLNQWAKGLYRVSMEWSMDGKRYYHEAVVVM